MDGNAMTSTADSWTAVEHPGLIALDWGTTRLRVFLLDHRGAVAAQREAPWGIQQLPGTSAAEGFNQAFEGMVGDWLARWPGLPVMASGMVGSAQGWREAPYLACPIEIASFHRHLTTVTSLSGTPIHIAPGLVLPSQISSTGAVLADVMRGEEIQVLGALSVKPEWAAQSCIVLPGTHSKWVWIEAGKVTHFMTSMAGELFAVLRQHSILGRLMPTAMPADSAHWAAFEEGLGLAYAAAPGMLISLLFSARSRVLTGELSPDESSDYLSGLLIGCELAAALKQPHDRPLTPLGLVGAPELSRRYEHALTWVGHPPAAVLDNTAPQGLWKVALSAGLASQLGEAHAA
jgi:2-dehydro-3-deoxygalactonokinase